MFMHGKFEATELKRGKVSREGPVRIVSVCYA